MPSMTTFIRKDIRHLSPPELDNLVNAFKGIQELNPDDPNSFFAISGLHGQPFRGAGYGNSDWWGGYCHHGNVLFPTWHRAYVLHIEKALRSIEGCESVALPYWNQMEPADGSVITDSIPHIFLQDQYTFLDGRTIDNPLYSYKLQKGFYDNLSRPDTDYRKPQGYTTVRYPYSGLVGPGDIDITTAHNDSIDKNTANSMLTENVANWLTRGDPFQTDPAKHIAMRQKYLDCLEAPNYTVFSNTTSAAKWNDDNFGRADDPDPPRPGKHVTALESPHNGMHLAVGGYDMPPDHNGTGANGDMGENDSASFDPIFYFHHCFVDLVFWTWQQRQNCTNSLSIEPDYPGTNSVDSQGPTPGMAAGAWLTMDSPLAPFKSDEGKHFTSQDMVSISKLGYDYEPVTALVTKPRGILPTLTPIIRVSGISRSDIAGSFIVNLWSSPKEGGSDSKQKGPDKVLVGLEPVFSRWHVAGCANCGNTLGVTTHLPLVGWEQEEAKNRDYTVEIIGSQNKPVNLPKKRIPNLKIDLGRLHYTRA